MIYINYLDTGGANDFDDSESDFESSTAEEGNCDDANKELKGE